MDHLSFFERYPIVSANQSGLSVFYDELPLWSSSFVPELLERAPISQNATIVDLGCGTGFLSIEIAQRCGPNSKVFAIDPWPIANERLRAKLDFIGIENVEVIQKNGIDTGLDAASVDLIVSNLGINNFEEPDRVLRECHRIAKPGACLQMTTNLVGNMKEFYAELNELLRDRNREDLVERVSKHVAHRGTSESVEQLIDQAGFRIVHSSANNFQMHFSDGSALFGHWFIRLAFLPDWMSLFPTADIEWIFSSLEDRLNTRAKESGRFSVTIPVAYFEALRNSDPHLP